MKVEFNVLLKQTEEFVNKEIKWHHHYLPPGCTLNKSRKHIIILEGDGRSWTSEFDEKPMNNLEKLENLFFSRKTI